MWPTKTTIQKLIACTVRSKVRCTVALNDVLLCRPYVPKDFRSPRKIELLVDVARSLTPRFLYSPEAVYIELDVDVRASNELARLRSAHQHGRRTNMDRFDSIADKLLPNKQTIENVFWRRCSVSQTSLLTKSCAHQTSPRWDLGKRISGKFLLVFWFVYHKSADQDLFVCTRLDQTI